MAYKFRIRETPSLRQTFARHAGAARWAWNWGLEHQLQHYEETGKYLSLYTLDKEFTAVRAATPWLQEVSKWAPRLALRNLDAAWKNFFKALKEQRYRDAAKTQLMWERPRFKKRGQCRASFQAWQCRKELRVRGDSFFLPKVGWVRLRLSRAVQGRILYLTVLQCAGNWFVSFTVEVPDPAPAQNQSAVGVDVGIKTSATLSGGTVFEAPKHLSQSLRRLQQAQRHLSRKQKGSMNRAKARLRVARLHAKVARQRRDWQCKIAAHVAKNHGVVCLETLSAQAMQEDRPRGFNRALGDAAMSGLQQRIAWAVTKSGGTVQWVGRYAPTSKTCSQCGGVQDMPLALRTYKCNTCGFVADRDLNAAVNIRTAGLAGIACGGTAVAAPAKQEARRGVHLEPLAAAG